MKDLIVAIAVLLLITGFAYMLVSASKKTLNVMRVGDTATVIASGERGTVVLKHVEDGKLIYDVRIDIKQPLNHVVVPFVDFELKLEVNAEVEK